MESKDHFVPYQSDSSNDSAFTFEYDLQREIIKRNSYYEDEHHLNLTKDFKELVFNFTCLALENELDELTQKHYIIDRFGFNYKEMNEKKAFLQQVLVEILNSKSEKAWTHGNCENLKTLVREYGIPNELRPKIWLSFIKNKVYNNYNIDNLLDLADETIQMFELGVDEMNIRQIDLDICRTMPNHKMFDEKANGLVKLRKILVAYSIHVNPSVGYCQAMNFLAALLLIIFNGNAKDALMGLICIIDYYFPPNYFDENLTGARADQMLLRDLILKKLTKNIKYNDEEELNRKLKLYSSKIDEITGSLSLNWFLSLFHNALPWQTRLYILDCFWLEGLKVLFRFGLALLPLENKLSYLDAEEGESRIGDLINQMKDECARYHDVQLLRNIAFRQLSIPGRKELHVKRSIYLQKILTTLNLKKQKDQEAEMENLNKLELDVFIEDQDESEDDNELKEKTPKKIKLKRSNSAITTLPNNRLNWLKKRFSLANFNPVSLEKQAEAAQKYSFKGLNGTRSCETISRNGERLVQMISSLERISRINLEIRDTQYSHIFYPNRRSSIVLSDSEQHRNAISTLKNLYNKDLILVGISDDGKWLVLLDQTANKLQCGWLKDLNVNILILSVPFQVKSWYFDEIGWQVICLDKQNQLWRCDLADPSKSSICTDLLKKQIENDPKSNFLNLVAYDDKYCLLWAHLVTKISPKDQSEVALKLDSKKEKIKLSFEVNSSDDEEVFEENGEDDFSNQNSPKNKYFSKKSNHYIVNDENESKKSLTDFSENSDSSIQDESSEDDEVDENKNQKGNEMLSDLDEKSDLCSCSLSSNNFIYNENFNEDCKESKNELLDQLNNDLKSNRFLSKRVSISSIFRRNSSMSIDNTLIDQTNLTEYLVSKHGQATLSNQSKNFKIEQENFQNRIKYAFENKLKLNNNSLEKKRKKFLFHQENFKNEQLRKIDLNEDLIKQQLYVFDACTMELFGILNLNPLDDQLKKIFCLNGVAYCGFGDGSIVGITLNLNSSNEQPTKRKLLLQSQPEDELIDLRVFNVNNPVKMDTIIQNTEQQINQSLESYNKSSSATSSIISSIYEDDEEIIHFDASTIKKKNSLKQTYIDINKSENQNNLEDKKEQNCKKENIKKEIIDGSIHNKKENRCLRTERKLPTLPMIFKKSTNSAFLVLALYKSGKLHCVYLKNDCVQERKLFRLDGKLKAELPIENLRVVNAFKMNWSEEDENKKDNDSDEFIKDEDLFLNKQNHEKEKEENEKKLEDIKNYLLINKENFKKDSNNNLCDLENSSPNESYERIINELKDETKNDIISQETHVNEIVNIKKKSSLALKERNLDSKNDFSERANINSNQCNYLVTLWCPHPVNRLVNVNDTKEPNNYLTFYTHM